jgi:hypothetical protein
VKILADNSNYAIAIAIAILGGFGAAFGAIMAAYLQRRTAERNAAEQVARDRDDVVRRYRDPLLWAAFELQSRLYNILRNDFLGKYFVRGTEMPPFPLPEEEVATLTPLEQDRIVDQSGNGSIRRPEQGDRAAGIRSRQLERPPARIDVGAAVGQPKRKLERRVAERPRERFSCGSGRRPLELDYEVGNRRTRCATPEQTESQRERNRHDGEIADPEPGCVGP